MQRFFTALLIVSDLDIYYFLHKKYCQFLLLPVDLPTNTLRFSAASSSLREKPRPRFVCHAASIRPCQFRTTLVQKANGASLVARTGPCSMTNEARTGLPSERIFHRNFKIFSENF
jgi:hypothetical protein